MYILLFIIINIIKFKVFSRIKCVPFINVLYSRRRAIMLQLQQYNIFVFRVRLELKLELFMFLTQNLRSKIQISPQPQILIQEKFFLFLRKAQLYVVCGTFGTFLLSIPRFRYGKQKCRCYVLNIGAIILLQKQG